FRVVLELAIARGGGPGARFAHGRRLPIARPSDVHPALRASPGAAIAFAGIPGLLRWGRGLHRDGMGRRGQRLLSPEERRPEGRGVRPRPADSGYVLILSVGRLHPSRDLTARRRAPGPSRRWYPRCPPAGIPAARSGCDRRTG